MRADGLPSGCRSGETDRVRIRQGGIDRGRKPGRELLDRIVMQIGPAQTLRFVLTPETGQIDRIHLCEPYPRREALSKTVRAIDQAGRFPFVQSRSASLIIGHV